jgi:hypothetical protein
MDLKEMRKQLVEAKAESLIDINRAPLSMKNNAEFMVRRGKEATERITNELISHLIKTGRYVGCLKTIPEADPLFQYISSTFNDSITLDAEELYSKTVDRLFVGEKGFNFSSSALNVLDSVLIDVGRFIGAEQMPLVKKVPKFYKNVKTRQEAVEHMKIVLDESYGTDILDYYLASQLRRELNSKILKDVDGMMIFIKNYSPSNYLNSLSPLMPTVGLDGDSASVTVSLTNTVEEKVKILLDFLKSLSHNENTTSQNETVESENADNKPKRGRKNGTN